MNDHSSSSNAFWPVTLLAISLIAILIWQLVLGIQAKQNLQAQVALPQRKQTIDQAKKVQTDLEKLVNDLLEAAKTDKDAQTIVEKYQIKRNDNPTAKK
jgi:cell division protein FtsB